MWNKNKNMRKRLKYIRKKQNNFKNWEEFTKLMN